MKTMGHPRARRLLGLVAALLAAEVSFAGVHCGPPDICVPDPCRSGCTVCVVFDDETGEYRGFVEYDCD